MEYRTLGRSDVEVSTVAMGCWAIVGDSTWGPQDEEDAIGAIETCLEEGVNFFDTAEAYGDGYSEELLGRVLSDRREDVVIATKVSPNHLRPEDLRESCEASLRRLQTDYIDLYQIHWPNWDIPFEDTLAEMKRLQQDGKIRVMGCSNFGPRDLTELLDVGRVEVDQLAYNLLWRGLEVELQDICVDDEVSILPYSPIQQGLLTGKFASPDEVPEGRARTRHFSNDRPQSRHGEPGAEELTFQAIDGVREVAEDLGEPMADVSLAWLLHQPAVTSVLAGMRNHHQARENARAGDLKLSSDVVDRLNEATRPLKEHFDGSLDMWQSDSRLR
jgi:aryl-alcohol dehydrogenase-like predicted oxidoreductase